MRVLSLQLGVTALRKDQLQLLCGLKHDELLLCNLITTKSPFGMDFHGRFMTLGLSV